MTPPQVCAVCLYVRTGVASDAVTVIEGYAVCDDHLGYVAQGQRFASILSVAQRPEEPQRRARHADADDA